MVNSYLFTLQISIKAFKIVPLPILQAVSIGVCLLKRCLIITRCLAACLDTYIINFQSSRPFPLLMLSPAHTAEILLLLHPATLAIHETQVRHMSSCRSLEISAHIFYFPGTQTDQATTDMLHYRILTI